MDLQILVLWGSNIKGEIRKGWSLSKCFKHGLKDSNHTSLFPKERSIGSEGWQEKFLEHSRLSWAWVIQTKESNEPCWAVITAVAILLLLKWDLRSFHMNIKACLPHADRTRSLPQCRQPDPCHTSALVSSLGPPDDVLRDLFVRDPSLAVSQRLRDGNECQVVHSYIVISYCPYSIIIFD